MNAHWPTPGSPFSGRPSTPCRGAEGLESLEENADSVGRVLPRPPAPQRRLESYQALERELPNSLERLVFPGKLSKPLNLAEVSSLIASSTGSADS